jgi:bacterioferritin-associated ferredoxin
MYICVCKAITENQIENAVEQGCLNELGIGSVCGKCLKEIDYEDEKINIFLNTLPVSSSSI